MCRHVCIKATRLLLGVAKNKESATQQRGNMCHVRCYECIKATRLLLGVAKNKESKK